MRIPKSRPVRQPGRAGFDNCDGEFSGLLYPSLSEWLFSCVVSSDSGVWRTVDALDLSEVGIGRREVAYVRHEEGNPEIPADPTSFVPV